jgi:hypothetical protein
MNSMTSPFGIHSDIVERDSIDTPRRERIFGCCIFFHEAASLQKDCRFRKWRGAKRSGINNIP